MKALIFTLIQLSEMHGARFLRINQDWEKVKYAFYLNTVDIKQNFNIDSIMIWGQIYGKLADSTVR